MAPVTAITAFLPLEEPRNPPDFLGVAGLGAFAGELTGAVADPRSIVAVTSSDAN
ncbi:hypothetical protein GCM10010404_25320 [Nonomuraea africana]